MKKKKQISLVIVTGLKNDEVKLLDKIKSFLVNLEDVKIVGIHTKETDKYS